MLLKKQYFIYLYISFYSFIIYAFYSILLYAPKYIVSQRMYIQIGAVMLLPMLVKEYITQFSEAITLIHMNFNPLYFCLIKGILILQAIGCYNLLCADLCKPTVGQPLELPFLQYHHFYPINTTLDIIILIWKQFLSTLGVQKMVSLSFTFIMESTH